MNLPGDLACGCAMRAREIHFWLCRNQSVPTCIHLLRQRNSLDTDGQAQLVSMDLKRQKVALVEVLMA